MPFDQAAAEAHFAALDTIGSLDEDGQTWHGPIDNCDVCSRPMGDETYMIDGPAGPGPSPLWGNLCVGCAFKHSPKIGWGSAQLYRHQGDQWYLVAGGPPPEDTHDL